MDPKQHAEELLSFFNMEKVKLQKLQKHFNEQFKSDNRKLETLEADLKAKISEATQLLKNELSSSFEKTRIEIEDEISRIEKQIADLSSDLGDLLTSENTSNDSEIMDAISKTNVTHARMPTEYLRLILYSDLQWMLNSHLPPDLGSCVTVSVEDKIGLELTESFETGLRSVDSLSPHKDGTVCLNSKRNKLVRKVELKDDFIIVKDIPSISVRNVAVMPSGDILLSIRSEPVIKIQRTTGDIKDFFTFRHPLGSLPQVAVGMHAVNDSEVVVCTMERNGSSYKLNETSHRQIVILNVKEAQGFMQKAFEYDDDNLRLFIFPYRVVSLKNGDICVVDRLSRFQGQIISLNRNGKLQWKFNEDAWDISATKTDMLVICNWFHHNILLLDNTGHLLHRCDLRAKFDIHFPCSLAIDNHNMLILGCFTKISKAKMYVFKFQGDADDIFW